MYQRSSRLLNKGERHKFKDLLIKQECQFAKHDGDLRCTELVKHRIETGDAAPIEQRPRQLPLSQREVAKVEVESMLKRGIIKPADGPWAWPIILVRKKNGKVKFCVDYRRLNAITRKDVYPIPRIDETIDTSGSSQLSISLRDIGKFL